MKKDSPLLSIEGKSVGKNIPKLAEVTYQNEGEYKSKALILWENNQYRVSFDDIGKPSKTGGIRFTLKPQDDLNIKGEYRLEALLSYTKDLLYNSTIYSDNLVNYLYGLILYAETPNDSRITSELKKMYSMWRQELPLNTINTDFGELIGAIYLFKHDRKFVGSTLLEFPSIGNEPLMDYKFKGKEEFIISAKSSSTKTSNVVKPAGVLNLLSKNNKLSKWSNTIAFDIISIIHNNSIQSAPSIVISKYKTKIPEFRTVKLDNRYECEKAIEKYSKTNSDFKKMFLDAIGANVYYAYFKIGNDGIPEIKCDPDSSMLHDIYLRTKNSTNSAGDKMGFQP